MKLPFRKTSPNEAMMAARSALAETEGRMRGLVEQRVAKLLDSEGVEEVAALDRQIETQEKAASILRDRIEAVKGELQRQAQIEADRELARRIASTEKALGDRDVIAVKLQAAITDMGRLYFELIDKNLDISRQWRMSNNALRVGLLYEKILALEVSHALFAAGRPRGGISRLPAPGNAGLGITGDTDSGTLAERIADASRALLEMIRAVPTGLPEDEAA